MVHGRVISRPRVKAAFGIQDAALSMIVAKERGENAMCESFFATLECELLNRRRFRSQAEAHMAVFTFIEG